MTSPVRWCHAAAGHAPADPRGPFGDLCSACWAAVQRLLKVAWIERPAQSEGCE
jgi:hypothetical protein